MLMIVATSPQITVVREVLEGMVSPDVAVAVLFSALDMAGDEPKTADQWADFVAGPLRDALAQRAGEEVAGSVISQIGMIFRSLMPTHDRPFDVPNEREKRRSELPTGRFNITSGPTRVLVVAGSGGLARRLKTVLRGAVVPMVLIDLSRATFFFEDFRPTLVVIDETDPIEADPLGLVKAFGMLPKDVLAVVWNHGSQRGDTLRAALEQSGRRVVHVDRGSDGVEPLLDIVKAHHTGS